MLHPIEQHVHCRLGGRPYREVHRRHRRLRCECLEEVVERDHRHVAWHVEAPLAQSLERAAAGVAVARHKRRELDAAVEEAVDCAHRGQPRMRSIRDERRVDVQAEPAQRHLVRPLPGRAVTVVAGEEGDAAVPVLDEMLHGKRGPALIVGHDRRPARPAREIHDGVPIGLEPPDICDCLRRRQRVDHDQPVGVPRAHGCEDAVWPRARPRRAGDPGSRPDRERGEQVHLPAARGGRQTLDQGLEVEIDVPVVDLPTVGTPRVGRSRRRSVRGLAEAAPFEGRMRRSSAAAATRPSVLLRRSEKAGEASLHRSPVRDCRPAEPRTRPRYRLVHILRASACPKRCPDRRPAALRALLERERRDSNPRPSGVTGARIVFRPTSPSRRAGGAMRILHSLVLRCRAGASPGFTPSFPSRFQGRPPITRVGDRTAAYVPVLHLWLCADGDRSAR